MTRNQQEIDKFLDRMIQTAEKDIDLAFAKRLKDILSQIAEMYRRYSEGGELTITALNKFNRYQKEMALISEQMTKHYKYLLQSMQELMEKTYLENYLRSAFLYEFESQQLMNYSVPSAQLLKTAIRNPIPKLTLPKLMETHRNEIVRGIGIEITQGLLAGEDYSRMARRIENTVNFSRNKSRRVARTESHRVQNQSRLDSMEQASKFANIEKRWLSTLDVKVRDAHQKLDNKPANDDGFFKFGAMKAKAPGLWTGTWGQYNPANMNINCRCSIIALVNGKTPEVRRARNYEDPKYQQKIADRMDQLLADGLTQKQAEKQATKEISPPSMKIPWMSYEEWLDNRF
ncbi:phage minor head protein [Bacillus gobiensis]|uniref:phage minor head protein n=1 Tax=Bacillus gobiensis TaxID=1441095 RepID=UPI003D21FC3E